MTQIPRPDFVDRDPALITEEAIARFEAETGNTLFPAQVERLIINLLAYRETLVRLGIQYAAEQNLVNFATEDRLEQLGVLLDVDRLPAAAALTTLRFTIPVQGSNTLIAAGTRATIPGSGLFFATDESLTITAGQTQGTVTATALTTGIAGNGFAIGTITQLVDLVPGIAATVTNLTITNSGADEEDDERYRARVKLAPAKFSVAGPTDAYRFWALSADQSIVDVAIFSPFRTRVEIYAITDTGLPSTEIKNKINAVVNDEKIRPLTDEVLVLDPDEVAYDVDLDVTLTIDADSASLQAQVIAEANAWADERRRSLGRDLVPSQLVAATSLPGVYRVVVNQPAYTVLSAFQWANAGTVTVNFVGTAEA